MKISIIGNGFDLRHEMPTGYRDFMEYYGMRKSHTNVLFRYLKKMDYSNGWLDLEDELSNFLKLIYKLRIEVSYSESKDYLVIDKAKFIYNAESQHFYKAIEEMNYEFFGRDDYNGSLMINDDRWFAKLTQYVNTDFEMIKVILKEYLKSIDDHNNFNKLDCTLSDIVAILESDVIYTFNYTNYLEKYVGKDRVNHVHGTLEENMVLGVPYDDKFSLREFNHFYKTSQSIEYKLNMPIPIKSGEEVRFTFIGYAFGESDHYFFQEIKDYVMMFLSDKYVGIANIYFDIFYHEVKSISSYIYNLRKFLGEEMLTRFDLESRINFIPYE